MPHAVRIHQTGGPDVMQWDSVEVGAPGPGQVRLKQHAVGVNYIDIYHARGFTNCHCRSWQDPRAPAR